MDGKFNLPKNLCRQDRVETLSQRQTDRGVQNQEEDRGRPVRGGVSGEEEGTESGDQGDQEDEPQDQPGDVPARGAHPHSHQASQRDQPHQRGGEPGEPLPYHGVRRRRRPLHLRPLQTQ